MSKEIKTKIFITEGIEPFDKVKNQLKRDVLHFYGEEKAWPVWNKIDHLKPIYILDHFPGLKATMSVERIQELRDITEERTRQDIATIKNDPRTKQSIFFHKDKPFTVQTAEKIDPDIRILRKMNYGRQPIPEIIKNLQAIAESKCINQPAPREASLWNAIGLLEDFEELSDWINKELNFPLLSTEPEGYKFTLQIVKTKFLQELAK